MTKQPGILLGLPDHGRFIELRLRHGAQALAAIRALEADSSLVVGLGPKLVSVQGLHSFRAVSGVGVEIPSTQSDLFLWLRGSERGKVAKQARELLQQLNSAFEVERMVDGFKYGVDLEIGMDLSGYEDGTENPQDGEAEAAAFAPDGSSYVSFQHWEHDLATFNAKPLNERDHIFGRQISDNEEIDDAPEFAHVKRTAQESFTPEAFVVRRSMPWVEAGKEGLLFAAFGHSLAAFEALLNRMAGLEDGIADGLFRFTQPVSGAHYWCPPVAGGKLDLANLTA